jgi:hypothetical protein
MLLRVLSDASFLSRPNAGSVAGGLSYLGLTDDDDWVNHPISCHSTRIPVVCSFVAEVEYVDLYAAARIATEERKSWPTWATPNPPPRCSATTRWPSALLPTRCHSGCARPPTCACIGSGTESARDTFVSCLSAACTTSPTSLPSLFLLPVIASWLTFSPPTLPTTTLIVL